MSQIYDPAREELFTIYDDVRDPTGGDERGFGSKLDLTKNATGHPLIRYRDVVIEADVYQIAGAPTVVHIICPKCRNALRITGDNKAIDYDEKAGDPKAGGRLSIETFECTWESDGTRRMEFGVNRCGWRVAVDNNIAKDA